MTEKQASYGQEETHPELDRSFEENLLASVAVEVSLVINRMLHDQADSMENLATARIMAGVRQRMLEWGMQNDNLAHEEREKQLHRMVNRLRSENHEAERKYAEIQAAEPQP